MTDAELQQQRKAKWRLDGRALRTIEEARAFVEEVGMVLVYPLRPALPLPTWIGAYTGSDERLPDARHAFNDPRAREAEELMVRLLREKAAFESNVLGESNLLVSASLFPYYYALLKAQETKGTSKGAKLSPLATDVFKVIQQKGAVGKQQLRALLRGEPSPAALDRALAELWSRLRITRVGYSEHEGALWDTFARWAPQAVKEGAALSTAEGLSAMLSKYLDAAIAADQSEIEDVLSHLAPRSRIKEAVNALLAARELSFLHAGARTLIQITPAPAERHPARTPAPPRAKRA
jgi:23S rRNA pseudouridine2605 synthase